MIMKNRKIKWRRLDNSAKIFPIISNKKFSTVFRTSVILKESIDREILQNAVEDVTTMYPAFKVKLRKGFFWYFFEENSKMPIVEEENNYPCQYIDKNTNNRYLFKVTYFDKKINLDVFHSLTDGNSAIKFLQEITYRYLDLKYEKGKNKATQKILSNNIEDSYLKNYDKSKAKRQTSKKAYNLKGKKLPFNAVGVVHYFINLKQLKEIAKINKATLTEYLVAVLAYCIYTKNYTIRKNRKLIKICVPVDLKQYFESKTTSNFFSYITIEINISDNITFEDILKQVLKEFQNKLKQVEIEKIMHSNIKLGNSIFIKLIPLLLKKFTVNLSYIEIRKYTTTTLSNIGKIDVKEDYKDKIENFLFLLAPESVEKIKCSIVSYENILTFTFTSILENVEIQKAFFNFLRKNKIEVKQESNGVYSVIS